MRPAEVPLAYAMPVPGADDPVATAPSGLPAPPHYLHDPPTQPSWTGDAHPLSSGGSARFDLPPSQYGDAYQPLPLTEEVYGTLAEQGYTRGLAEALMRNKMAFPLRIWVVDNSGSMMTQDGHRLVETHQKNDVKLVPCTRWAEMQQTVTYHAQLGALLNSPTVFRLLNDPGRVNGPQQFSVAERGPRFLDEDLAVAQQTMANAMPGGVTPLTRHVQEIRANIAALEPTLRQDGTKVVIVLATDGLPTTAAGLADQTARRDFLDALRSLESLPVWLVVRLSTDDESVVEYYNNLDSQLELSLEVLDDFQAEAAEVNKTNPWLNYGLPLHRMREMGFHNRLFDLLDERKLSIDELRGFCRILFGEAKMDGVPDAQMDKKGFVAALTKIVATEKKQWNPLTQRLDPWIDMKKLKHEYHLGSSLLW